MWGAPAAEAPSSVCVAGLAGPPLLHVLPGHVDCGYVQCRRQTVQTELTPLNRAGALVGVYLWRRTRRKKKPSRVVIAITGFGKFKGVGENPTQRFVKALPFFLKANPLPAHVVVDRCIVMEVSAQVLKGDDISIFMCLCLSLSIDAL